MATVAVDGGVNAALLSIEIISLTDEGLAEKLAERRRADSERVLAKNKAVEEELNQ